MALEDNFLNLDSQNYNSELEYLLNSGSFSLDDCLDLYESKKISKKDYDFCKEFFEE